MGKLSNVADEIEQVLRGTFGIEKLRAANRPIDSVPWRLLGKTVLVHLMGSSVEIYWEHTRVATHARTTTGTSQTNEDHLSETRLDYRYLDPAYSRERASALHADIGTYIDEVLPSNTVQIQITNVAAMVCLFEQEEVKRARAT